MKSIDEKFAMPECLNINSKPSLFCPGCGHSIILKHLGQVIDQMKLSNKITLGIDIGCSLLAWNYFNFDIVQTHHGRSVPTMIGYKMTQPRRLVLSYMGDGGGYAIGLQSLIHAAFRNNPITVIVVNNTEFAMTGGQMAPTTMPEEKTSTSPEGKKDLFGGAFLGPELIRQVADPQAYVARATVSNPVMLDKIIEKAFETQIEKQNFSFVEILSICPTNWKTSAMESFEFLSKMEKTYKIGEIVKNVKTKNN